MDHTALKSYVDAMVEAAAIVKKEDPHFLVAPMSGSVPFIDAMAIVDRDFDPSRVVYMPASSRIVDVNNVIFNWYSGLLNESVNSPNHFPKVMGIDEVVSGQSVLRCVKMIDKACRNKISNLRQGLVSRVHSPDPGVYLPALDEIDTLTQHSEASRLADIRAKAKSGTYRENHENMRQDSHFLVEAIKTGLKDKLVYKTIGIEDSKKPQRVSQYENLKTEGRVFPVSVKWIITMDRPEFVPVRFKQRDTNFTGNPYLSFEPVVEGFSVTPAYINFLKSLANYVGTDPEKVAPINMPAILNSGQYLKPASK